MRKLILLFLMVPVLHLQAQYKFMANQCSGQYDARLSVESCESGRCNGKGTVVLYDKITKTEIASFQSADLDFNLTSPQDIHKEGVELGKYQSPIIFGDFNFDGLEDLAIRNGNQGAYSSPSYDIYLAHAAGKFVKHDALTTLASQNLGLFDVDKKNKTLTIHIRSGCCYQQSISYQINAKNLPVEVLSVIEDSSIGDEVTVITIRSINGKSHKSIQKFKTKDYYAES